MRKGCLAIFAALAVTGAAAAAEQPAGGHPGWNRADMQQMRAKFQEMRAKREARRADDIALLLGLRPDQRPAFDAFLASMKPSHDGHGDKRGGDMSKSSSDDATLSTRLDAMDASAEKRYADFKQRTAATRQFYNSLTPEQQRRFDALDRLRRGHMHGHRAGFGGHRGMGAGPGTPPSAPAGG